MIRIILVDDHHITRAGIKALLEREKDIEIVGDFDSGRNILEILNDLQPDVLLLDMAMPGLSGQDVALKIREANIKVKILVLSAHATYDYIKQMLNMGVAGYLRKDETVEMIADAIRGVSRGERGWFSRSSYITLQKTELMDFSKREIQVLKLLSKGFATADISAELNISENTVKTYTRRIAKKIGVKSNREIMRWAWEQGFSKQ